MFKVRLVNGMIVVDAEAKRPVIVYASERAIPSGQSIASPAKS